MYIILARTKITNIGMESEKVIKFHFVSAYSQQLHIAVSQWRRRRLFISDVRLASTNCRRNCEQFTVWFVLANHNATQKHIADINIGTFTNENKTKVFASLEIMLVSSIPSPSFHPRFVYLPFMQPFGSSFCRRLQRFRWGSVGLGWWALVVDACLEWRSTWKSSSQDKKVFTSYDAVIGLCAAGWWRV